LITFGQAATRKWAGCRPLWISAAFGEHRNVTCRISLTLTLAFIHIPDVGAPQPIRFLDFPPLGTPK